MKPAKSPVSQSTIIAVSALDSMWARVDAVRDSLREDYVAERPPDSFTAKEYCLRFDIPPATGQHQIESLVRRGLVKRYRTILPDRMSRNVIQNIYVLIKSEKNSFAYDQVGR